MSVKILRSQPVGRLLLALGALALPLATIGVGEARAGSERLTAPGSGVPVSLVRGSDLGTICYEILFEADPPGEPRHGMSAGIYTEPADPIGQIPQGTLIFSFSIGTPGELHAACAAGLDQAVVTDIFANPGDYYFTRTDCYELIGCFSFSVPLALAEAPPPPPDPGPSIAPGPLPDTAMPAASDINSPLGHALIVGLLIVVVASLSLAIRRVMQPPGISVH